MPYMQIQSMLIFCGRSSKLTEETLASIVAESSQQFINQNKLCDKPFESEKSASAFSVSKSDIDKVCKSILNQPEHHRKVTFAEEDEEFIKFYQKTPKPSKKSQSK